jgi:hypothetical protein
VERLGEGIARHAPNSGKIDSVVVVTADNLSALTPPAHGSHQTDQPSQAGQLECGRDSTLSQYGGDLRPEVLLKVGRETGPR